MMTFKQFLILEADRSDLEWARDFEKVPDKKPASAVQPQTSDLYYSVSPDKSTITFKPAAKFKSSDFLKVKEALVQRLMKLKGKFKIGEKIIEVFTPANAEKIIDLAINSPHMKFQIM